MTVLEHDHLVPIRTITESSVDSIHVNLTKDDLNRLEQFTVANYISSDLTDEWRSSRSTATDFVYGGAGAIDGRVGRVDEVAVNPDNHHISHIIMREGHLWGAKDVTIPISNTAKIKEDCVLLDLDK